MSDTDRHRWARGSPPARFARRCATILLLIHVWAAAAVPVDGSAQLPTLPHAPDPFRTNALVGPDTEARLVLGATAFGDDSGIRGAWGLALRRRLIDGVTLHGLAGTYRAPVATGGRSTEAQLGTAVDVLLRRSTATLSAHGGLGYLAVDDGHVVSLPVGLGATLEIARVASLLPRFESTGGPGVYLWALPRVELLARVRGDASGSDVVAGGSVGLGVSSSEGVGILLGLDARDVSDDAVLPSLPEWSWGLSLRYRF
jgi:hypothetical protein